eukprot:1061815-Ditylum_brightwellii.AAC.1
MAKILFNSEDEPPTEQYLCSDYDYTPDQAQIEEASHLLKENIEYSPFIANMTYIERVGE